MCPASARPGSGGRWPGTGDLCTISTNRTLLGRRVHALGPVQRARRQQRVDVVRVDEVMTDACFDLIFLIKNSSSFMALYLFY